MVECGRHLNIEILTLSELESVSGEAGNFTVTVKKQPRFVDMEKCIACGICAEKCPKKVDDEHNAGISKRKAAYIKYGQTVPLSYALDPETCIYLQKGKCGACAKACPSDAINFDEKEEQLTLNVGALILAPGFQPFSPSNYDYTGYGVIPDVVTSMEYERLLSAGGPNMGHLKRPSDDAGPMKVAWIQCVGSRSINREDKKYCSSVCCMYAIKQAGVTRDHLPKGASEQAIFNMDIRCHGKEFDNYYEDARDKAIRFVKARPHTILPGPGGKGVRLSYAEEAGTMADELFDMVVLSVGMTAQKGVEELAQVTGIALDEFNFAQSIEGSPIETTVPGIYAVGSFRAPMGIPRAVTQASAAASEVSVLLKDARGEDAAVKSYPQERAVENDEPRIGVFVCSCGVNIAGVVDVAEVAEFSKTLPGVVHVENNLFTCSTDTQALIAGTIEEHNLNRVVVAACTPRTHEPLFQDTLKESALNGFLFEMANIRNHNAWVHKETPAQATEKAKVQVRMAVAKVGLAAPLYGEIIDVTQKALVIGGGVSGMQSALELANQGYPTTLVEKKACLGGNALFLDKSTDGSAVGPMLDEMIASLENHPDISVMTGASVVDVKGSVGKFTTTVEVAGGEREFMHGVAVLATGAKESVPDEHLFGRDSRVMTHLMFDKAFTKDPQRMGGVDCTVFIQCVGSRDENRPYCSRVCCSHTAKKAVELKEMNPDMRVVVLYREMRTFGTQELLYQKARALGVIFMRYTQATKPHVVHENGHLVVRAFDPVLQRPLAIEADQLVLAAAIESNGNAALAELFKCGTNADGFINEAHPKLRPVDVSVDGLFVAGLCNYPKTLDESKAQAKAAAARAGIILAKEKMELDPVKSVVMESCDGCALCLDVCPYDALSLIEYTSGDQLHKKIESDHALCKGCGLCSATCPKEGITVKGFTGDQLWAQVEAALSPL